jgi:hypothetical protein
MLLTRVRALAPRRSQARRDRPRDDERARLLQHGVGQHLDVADPQWQSAQWHSTHFGSAVFISCAASRPIWVRRSGWWRTKAASP